MAKAKSYTVVRQDWTESEAGWGQRHRNKEHAAKFIDKYWDEEHERNPSGQVPSVYVRPEVICYLFDVDEETYLAVKASRRHDIHAEHNLKTIPIPEEKSY
jgi:hypothetical protein